MLIACISVNAWHHSPDSAARVASEFAENALVREDYASARALMFPEFVEVLPAEGLAGLVAQMHPDGLPNEVRATEYQPIPGFEGMNIFLEGRSGSSVFYYRILVHGTSTSGYEVAGFFRGSGPYPNAEARHPLD